MDEAGSRSRRASAVARFALLLSLILPLAAIEPASAAPSPNQHFARTWERTDRPVADLSTSRTWMWGPAAFSGAIPETYLEAPNGSRVVQYYDKSRMEITDPAGNAASSWFVTNGLLVVELVSGRLQAGDDAFVQLPPAAVNVAGDPDDPAGPTYATIASLLDVPPAIPGAIYTQRLARDGTIVADSSLAARGVVAALVDDVTGHAVAAPFWAFMTSSGVVWDGQDIVHDRLFENPYYATGRPISEAYWATVRLAGTPRDVLLQCFERRCLTYTPDNPDGWRVEAGNVGRHYFTWRYESGHEHSAVWVNSATGARVNHGGSVAVDIPADALSGPAIVSIANASPRQLFTGFVPIGDAWRIEMNGAELVAPVTLSFAIDSALVPHGTAASAAQIAFFDAAAGHWTAVPTMVDLTASRASAKISHLSVWQLFVPIALGGDPPGTDPPGPSPTPPPPSNIAPQVDLNGPDAVGGDGVATARAGAGPVAVAPLARVVDPDDDTLVSIVIELLDARDGAQEWLSATAMPSVVVSRDQNRHRLQLGGPSPRADLEQVLRTLTFEHDGDEHATPGDRRIEVRASDAANAGSVASVIISVIPAPANQAPEVADTTVTTAEDVPVAVALAATDPDGDGVSWALVSEPQHGALSGVLPDLVYTPAANFHGADSFAWSATDTRGASSTATVSITVEPVNDAPTATAVAIVTDEDVAVPIVLSGSDPDGDILAYVITSPPAHGTLSGDAPELLYTPDADFSGEDGFAFTVSDGIAVSKPATVTITIRAVNDPPMAGGQQITTDEDVSVAITLDGTDDGPALTFAIVEQPAHGTLSGAAPFLTYMPDRNFNGNDRFTYTVADGEHVSDPAQVSIVVNPVNDAPVASAQAITVLEDGEQYITLTGSDVDGDVVRFTISRSPELGNVSVDGDWRCVPGSMPLVCSHVVYYAPLADVNGSDSFEFTVSDGKATSASAAVTITIVPVNDPPIARDDDATAIEDSSGVVLNVLANDSTGPDLGETLEIVSVTSFSHGGSAVISGNTVLYTPAPDFYGTETFQYSISDGHGGTASATVTVVVTGVNDNPTAVDDAFELDEDSGPRVLDVLANDDDAPDRDEALTIEDYTLPAHGSLRLDGVTGALSYQPVANFNGVDSFTYTIADGNGGSATAAVTITVLPVNDPPAAYDDAIEIVEDAGPVTIEVLVNDSIAPDSGETLAVVAVGAADLGTAEVISGGVAVRYTPNPDAYGVDSFTYTISDGELTATATVTVTIEAVNDSPVLGTSSANLTYVEDALPLALAPDLAVADVDSEIVSATIRLDARPDGAAEILTVVASHTGIAVTADPVTGAITLSGAAPVGAYQEALRSLTYANSSQAPTPGTRVATIMVSDGALSASVGVSFAIVPINDPPVLVFGGVVQPDSGPILLDPGATVSDVDSSDFDGGQLSATITGGYDAGDRLLLVPNGSLAVSGSMLTWGDGGATVEIGQINSTDQPLVITFNASATPERVQAVVRALAFATTSTSPTDRLVSVVVSDGDGGGSETGIVTVGVNQPPADIALSNAAVPEDAVSSAVVGQITGSDPNGDILSFALVDGSDARFEVVLDGAAWLLRVAGSAAFDHETEPHVTVTIRATDPAGRSYDEPFIISVTDVNEPPVLTGDTSLEVDENSPVGAVVGQLGVADPDAGQSHTFAITDGNDAGAFGIDMTTGEITVADSGPLDFETMPLFAIVVTVVDDGTPALSGSVTVTIALTDLPEEIIDTQPPLVENLTYDNLIGNLRLRAGSSDGLLSTSSDPEGSALEVVGAEPYDGLPFGSLDWRSDGSFTWDPPVGAKNTAGAWKITVADSAGNQATGLVSFSIGGRRVIHIDNTYTGTLQDGRWDTPYKTLAPLGNGSVSGDIIYLASGSGPYTGGIALKSGQTLVGAGAVGETLPALLGLPAPALGTQEFPTINAANPVITNTGGVGVTLSGGVVIDGVTFGATRDAAIYGRGDSATAGPTIRNVTIEGSGASVGPALDLSGYAGGSLSFQRIERAPEQTAGAQAVVQLLDMPGSSIVVAGPLKLTTTAMRGLYVRGIGSIEVQGGLELAINGSYEGIYSQSSVVRLVGVAPKSIVTSGRAAVWLRAQSSLIVVDGNLRVSTTDANGLDAYDSTVALAGAGNTIASTNGIAFSMIESAVGEGGIALDAVSASGKANGIVVDTVAGGPIVIGTAAPDAAVGDGGTLTGTTGPAILLRHTSDVTLRLVIVGAADATVGEAASTVNAVGGAGIDASYVDALTLDRVKIGRTGSHGVFGREVSRFVMTGSQVINAGDAVGEHGLAFDGPAAGTENGMTGVSLITDSVIDGFWDTGLVVRNAPPSLSTLDLTVARTTFSGNVVAGGGIRLRAEGLTTMDALVDGCLFERLSGEEVDGRAFGAGTLNLTVQ